MPSNHVMVMIEELRPEGKTFRIINTNTWTDMLNENINGESHQESIHLSWTPPHSRHLYAKIAGITNPTAPSSKEIVLSWIEGKQTYGCRLIKMMTNFVFFDPAAGKVTARFRCAVKLCHVSELGCITGGRRISSECFTLMTAEGSFALQKGNNALVKQNYGGFGPVHWDEEDKGLLWCTHGYGPVKFFKISGYKSWNNKKLESN